MEPRLVFEGVWKRFRRGQVHDSLRELVPAMARKLAGRRRPELEDRDFWALRDVSFEVRPGEVLGIIGGNGAGKSTTLKILNELMEPTKGRVLAHGKIGSLIEVSAGFHQDLTGRQNVFLQGAIMGMREAEVRRKFDQIVEFAGVADFIDTPVKRYSSGMNARLGFSIAAHLEPDVLIIDEVLAVGDHMFQQRAFGKIKSMAESGVPVVLVSHQLDRIAELSTKVILLEKGQIKASGSAAHCLDAYLRPDRGESAEVRATETGFRFDGMTALNGLAHYSGDDLSLLVTGECLRESYPPSWTFALHVINPETGTNMHFVLATQRAMAMPSAQRFAYRFDLQMNVPPGQYYAEFIVVDVDRGAEVVFGPRLYVEVFEGLKHGGAMQLNSRWRAVDDADAVAGAPVLALAPTHAPGWIDQEPGDSPAARAVGDAARNGGRG